MFAMQWDDRAGIRERLALLAALFGSGSGPVADRVRRATYDPSRDEWEIALEPGELGPARVSRFGEASVSLDRLRKRGVTYREAMNLIGYPVDGPIGAGEIAGSTAEFLRGHIVFVRVGGDSGS